jgi:signal transduction histidine kinase
MVFASLRASVVHLEDAQLLGRILQNPVPRNAYRRMPGYNALMASDIEIFEDMKAYIGFDERDADNLRHLAPVVAPHLPGLVDRFYDRILNHPGAKSVLTEGEAQIQRFRGYFQDWLRSLFGGEYDESYIAKRMSIGRIHVQVGLPQHYMFTAIEVVWQGFERIIRSAHAAHATAKLHSLHKLLTLEIGLMLESYKISYSDKIRQLERESVEERLSRAEHLAQIGQLAASLAHEIKNPLAGISGAIQVIRDETPNDHVHRPVLHEILQQINRIDGTVRDLLLYARPQPPHFTMCQIIDVVERVGVLLKEEPTLQRLQIEYDLPGPIDSVEADTHQIEQLMTNLILNAAHASQSGGSIRLALVDGVDHVLIEIADDGSGMDEQSRRRAFEPFYTTKTRGTGLGLSICRRIVDAHHGAISIDSRFGDGTTILVRLPRSQPQPSSEGG